MEAGGGKDLPEARSRLALHRHDSFSHRWVCGWFLICYTPEKAPGGRLCCEDPGHPTN